jgi:hypothetical protein
MARFWLGRNSRHATGIQKAGNFTASLDTNQIEIIEIRSFIAKIGKSVYYLLREARGEITAQARASATAVYGISQSQRYSI